MDDLEQRSALMRQRLLDVNSQFRESIAAKDHPDFPEAPGVITSAYMTNNAAADLISYGQRQIGLVDDPNFDSVAAAKAHSDLPPEYRNSILHATSAEEVRRIKEEAAGRAQAAKRLQAAGVAGVAASLLAGVVDIDAPLSALSDGGYLAAKVGKSAMAIRAARAVEQGVAGAASGAITTTAQAWVNPEIDGADVVQASLAGMLFAGTIGATHSTAKQQYLNTVSRQMDEFHDNLRAERAVGKSPEVVPDETPIKFRALDPEHSPEDDLLPGQQLPERKSVGAAGNGTAKFKRAEGILTPQQEDLISEAQSVLDYANIDHNSMKYAGGLGKFEKWSGEKLGIDWYTMANSNSPAARYIAHLVLEAPTGRGGRRTTAAIDAGRMHDIMLDGMPEDATAFKSWVNDTRPIPDNATSQIKRSMEMRWDNSIRREFDQAVHLEMNNRSLGRTDPDVHPDVKRAADVREKMAETAFNIQKHAGVPGFEKLEYTRGYQPYKHLGEVMLNAIRSGKTKDDIVALYSEGYKRANSGIDPRMADGMASAVVNRYVKREAGMDVSLYNILNADGRAFLTDGLISNGIPKDEAVRLVEHWSGQLKDKGTIGHAKSRNELDLSTELNGMKLIDFLNSDYVSTWSHYAKGAAGEAALSKVGLGGADKRTAFRDALIADQIALGEKPMAKEFIDDVFSYFGAGPMSGAVGPFGQTIKKLSSTNYLGKLGITQAGETGVSIAAIGMENYLAHDPVFSKFISEAKRGRIDGALLAEMEVFAGKLSQEHLLHRLPYNATEEMHSVNDVMGLVDKVNQVTGRALRLEMYLNGFNHIQQWQRARAMEGMATKVFKMLRSGEDMNTKRMLDIGIDERMQTKLRKYIDRGDVQFLPNGVLDVLGMDKWELKDATDFASIMRRSTDQLVHRAVIGEGGVWMHKGFASMLTHLQTFTLTSLHKQVFRNVNIADDVTAAMTVLGLTTAGIGYVAKQVIDGKYDNLDLRHIAVGAFSMSNMTGPFGTAAGMLGNVLGTGGSYGRNDGVIGVPAVDWANRAVRAPVAAVRSIFGGVSKKDRNSLTAVPGATMAGMARVFDVLQDDDK